MKKCIRILGALALSTCNGAVFAQSNVTFYGVVDMGISHDRGGIAGNATRATSGMATQSRWGFKGKEELGSGMAALIMPDGATAVALHSRGRREERADVQCPHRVRFP